jgi:hypothetical protein
MGEQHVIEFETALMALEPMKKIPQPCPKKTMTFGVALTKKNFEYLRPNQIKEIKAKQKEAEKLVRQKQQQQKRSRSRSPKKQT